MGIKSLKRSTAMAYRLQTESDHALLTIASQIRRISGAKRVSISYLPGAGFGVFLDNNISRTPLSSVTDFLEANGSITEDDIADMSCL